MKNITKKNLRIFFKEVKKILSDNDAIEIDKRSDMYMYSCEIKTTVGPLTISLHEECDLEGTSIYSIFCRFKNSEKAHFTFKNKSNLSHEISKVGKWNFHYTDMELCLAIFKTDLERLIPEVKLSHCPFCDGEDLKECCLTADEYTIYCNTCYAEGPMASTIKEAIKKWNTRYNYTPLHRKIANDFIENNRIEIDYRKKNKV